MINRKKLLILALTFSAITIFKIDPASASTAYTGMRDITGQELLMK